jgi:hypothetical protein
MSTGAARHLVGPHLVRGYDERTGVDRLDVALLRAVVELGSRAVHGRRVGLA